MASTQTTCSTMENVEVECTHCGVRMTSHVGSGQRVRYFHCPSCARWTTSVYTEVLRADSKMRSRKPQEGHQSTGSVKARLDAWLAAISANDPYATLGVSPQISDAGLRERYLALAREHHPDRGGDAEQMRRLNEAYEKALAHREQRRARQPVIPALP
jgi:DnaJ domain